MMDDSRLVSSGSRDEVDTFSFTPGTSIPGRLGRTGVIHTPHGDIRTPAFIVVGTAATVKGVLPRDIKDLGAQAVLANAYHLYLQPGSDIVDEAGGVGSFMGWDGPTFTDSGGFQVLSQGAGFKKVLAMSTAGLASDDVIAKGKDRLAVVDDDGVNFRSYRDGSKHRFTPEVSMGIQHQLGADIMFAFDECTTLMNTRGYQESSLDRTYAWALRCLAEHRRLTVERVGKPYQALFGVVQGAQFEDLRRKAARDLAEAEVDGQIFDGFGIGGALEKENLGTICRWVNEELPVDKPRHLLGISEPEDLFAAIEQGADTFDCVNPSRTARNGRAYTHEGWYNVDTLPSKRSFTPIEEGCDCYTCAHYTRAYLHHLARSKELVLYTLMTIHNERFHVHLVDQIRKSIDGGYFDDYRTDFLGRYRRPA
ncbi:MAG: tRNA guanosine(34) transglycosylase Tgt [Propionibacteriaceae bacterium]|jgi:queuine tRNA-ribosyltransferase|nr:tRNA guanosine(34) transglycosylase Tgt [Propionibacteriaceae bacterium]